MDTKYPVKHGLTISPVIGCGVAVYNGGLTALTGPRAVLEQCITSAPSLNISRIIRQIARFRFLRRISHITLSGKPATFARASIFRFGRGRGRMGLVRRLCGARFVRQGADEKTCVFSSPCITLTATSPGRSEPAK